MITKNCSVLLGLFKTSRLSRLLLTGAVILGAALSTTSRAQTNFFEDFEFGNLTNWTTVGTALDIQLGTNKVPTGGSYSALMTNGTCRMVANLPTGLGITNESYKFTHWYYDNSGSATRAYNEVRVYGNGNYNNGSLLQLLASGKMNNVTMAGETYSGTKYQARITFGSPSGWFQLDGPGTPNRSTGWHKFDVERGTNTASEIILTFYVDGVLSRTFTNSAGTTLPWDSVVLGIGLGTTVGNAWFDGLQVISGEPYFAANPPATTTNTVNDTVTIEANAYGGEALGPLAYQWRKNGANISGATTNPLQIVNAQIADSGSYTLVVSNLIGPRTSSVAYVQVNGPLLITLQPTNQIVNPGSSATFYGGAVSTSGNLGYKWQKNGVNLTDGGNITGSDTDTLVINPVGYPDAASYSFIATNLVDPPLTSSNAVLTVNTNPVFSVGSTQVVTLGGTLGFLVTATDDIGAQAAPFQTFDTNNVGKRVMFTFPSFSGTTDLYVDNPGTSAVTDTYPGAHGSKVLGASFTFTNNSPPAYLRYTTTSGDTNVVAPNPIIYYTKNFSTHLRFDMYSDKDINVCIAVRESNPTGAIGANAGSSSAQIEFLGISAGGTPPTPTRTVTASNWTTLDFDIPNEPIVRAYGVGNDVLNSTTDKGNLESLNLVPADGLAGTYNIYLDNFVSTPPNALTFSLDSGPDGMSIDPYSGFVSWTPTNVGNYTFSAIATDYLGLSSTNTYSVKVVIPPLKVAISGPNVVLTWTGTFTLQSAPEPFGPWTDVPGPVTTSPYSTAFEAANTLKCYRLRN